MAHATVSEEYARRMLAREIDLRPLFDDGGRSAKIFREFNFSTEAKREAKSAWQNGERSALAMYMSEAMKHRLLAPEEVCSIFQAIESVRFRLYTALEVFRSGEIPPLPSSEMTEEHMDGAVVRKEVIPSLRSLAAAVALHHDIPAITKESLRVCEEFCAHLQSLENLIVCSYLRFVVSQVKNVRWKGMRLPWVDLIQEGNLGLLATVWSYDWRLENDFSTPAIWQIQARIRQYKQLGGREVRLPARAHALLARIAMAKNYLTARLKRPPTQEEVYDYLELTEYQRRSLHLNSMEFSGRISFNEPLFEYGVATIEDVIEDPNAHAGILRLENQERDREITAIARACLTDREWRVLCLRFGIGVPDTMALEEIGKLEEFGITSERVRQIEEMAPRKIKNNPRACGILQAFFREE